MVKESSFVLAESPLFLSVFDDLLLHVKPFALPNAVHVLQCLIGRICFFSKVEIFFFSSGHPERIAGDDLRNTRNILRTFLAYNTWNDLQHSQMPKFYFGFINFLIVDQIKSVHSSAHSFIQSFIHSSIPPWNSVHHRWMLDSLVVRFTLTHSF